MLNRLARNNFSTTTAVGSWKEPVVRTVDLVRLLFPTIITLGEVDFYTSAEDNTERLGKTARFESF